MAKAQAEKAVRAIQIDLSIPIAAPRDHVWRSLVQKIGSWWSKDFFALKKPENLTLEPNPGGRMFESNTEGAGLVWYTVIAVEPGESMNLAGHIAPPFGGPATTLLRLQLEDAPDGGTVLNVSDSLFGCVDEGTRSSVTDGWRFLFEENLKRFAESEASRG
jgi:hypothetical protein